MIDNFLSAHHIVKHYARHTALDDVSIDVPRGKIFGLLGPNGAGKTTFIRIINRITMPDEGEVIFDGKPFTADDIRRIGYLPEERGLYKKMKVGEQAIYLAQLKGLSRPEAKARLTEWFERFDIMPWWNKKLEELSKGMQQKVQFIITTLHRPSLLILDEPFSGFDPVNAELLKAEILRLKALGHTIIFSTHNMASVEEICDEIALINRSKVMLHGEVQRIKEEHRTGKYTLTAVGNKLESTDNRFAILHKEEKGLLTHYTLEKAPTLSNSALVETVAKQVEIRRFEEQLPSMHDIFLKIVEGSKIQAQ